MPKCVVFFFFFWVEGNIQGGGQTFPGQFKRHYGSQIFESTKQVHTDLANDAKICNKSELYYSLKKVSRSAWLIVLPTSALKKLACRFWKTRSWSNVRCTLKKKICWSSPFVSNLGFIRLIIDKDMTLSGWFWWYLWPKMAFKLSQEFLTTSLDITNSKSALISNICSGVRRWDFIYQSCRKTVFVCSLSRRFLKELICVLGIICQSVLVAWLLNEFPSNVQ